MLRRVGHFAKGEIHQSRYISDYSFSDIEDLLVKIGIPQDEIASVSRGKKRRVEVVLISDQFTQQAMQVLSQISNGKVIDFTTFISIPEAVLPKWEAYTKNNPLIADDTGIAATPHAS